MNVPMCRIRPFAPADEGAVHAMAFEVVTSGAAFVYETVEGVLDYWLADDTECFVAEDAFGSVVGTYALKPNQAGRGAHVANAGYMVVASARGHGVGRLLAEHSIVRARERGYLAMQFNMVVSTNGDALRLWRELGFAVVATLPRAFRHATLGLVDAHVMFRTLDDAVEGLPTERDA